MIVISGNKKGDTVNGVALNDEFFNFGKIDSFVVYHCFFHGSRS